MNQETGRKDAKRGPEEKRTGVDLVIHGSLCLLGHRAIPNETRGFTASSLAVVG